MTTPILNSANAGLQKANEQLNKAARSIIESASGQHVSYKDIQDDALNTGDTNTPPAIESSSQSQTTTASTGSYIPSLAEEIVQLKLAAHAYKANARLLRAADEVSRAVLDSLNDKKDG